MSIVRETQNEDSSRAWPHMSWTDSHTQWLIAQNAYLLRENFALRREIDSRGATATHVSSRFSTVVESALCTAKHTILSEVVESSSDPTASGELESALSRIQELEARVEEAELLKTALRVAEKAEEDLRQRFLELQEDKKRVVEALAEIERSVEERLRALSSKLKRAEEDAKSANAFAAEVRALADAEVARMREENAIVRADLQKANEHVEVKRFITSMHVEYVQQSDRVHEIVLGETGIVTMCLTSLRTAKELFDGPERDALQEAENAVTRLRTEMVIRTRAPTALSRFFAGLLEIASEHLGDESVLYRKLSVLAKDPKTKRWAADALKELERARKDYRDLAFDVRKMEQLIV